MTYLKVRHKSLDEAANSIERYISAHNSKMNESTRTVDNLRNDWNGKDYIAVKNAWLKLRGQGSTSDRMVRSLQNYANYLRLASKKYKNAQKNAVDRANRLPRY